LIDSGTPVAAPLVEVSWGELIDKLTILEIKEQRLTSPESVANVRKELAKLRDVVQRLQPRPIELDNLKARLKSVNEMLWDIEDRIRAKEAVQSFDGQFIELARSVYFNNDHRAQLKHEINVLLKSDLIEEKQYTAYKAR
jgi:predicted  nucleic acid-binding Zn-ribbon protein